MHRSWPPPPLPVCVPGAGARGGGGRSGAKACDLVLSLASRWRSSCSATWRMSRSRSSPPSPCTPPRLCSALVRPPPTLGTAAPKTRSPLQRRVHARVCPEASVPPLTQGLTGLCAARALGSLLSRDRDPGAGGGVLAQRRVRTPGARADPGSRTELGVGTCLRIPTQTDGVNTVFCSGYPTPRADAGVLFAIQKLPPPILGSGPGVDCDAHGAPRA